MAIKPHATGSVDREKELIERLLKRVDELGVLPHVVWKVLELTGNQESSASAIEAAITVDPGFSSKLLMVANSATFGLPRRVSTVRESVMFLGFRTVRTLAMTVATFDMFVGKTDRGSLRRRGWWRHSIDSAICCRWLAEKNRGLNADEAYTGGLLHLLGKNLLDRFGGESYDEVMVRVDRGYTDVRAEKEVYGITHIRVMQQAAISWHLPEQLCSGLNYAEPAEGNAADAKLRACVALGSRLAYLAKHGQDEVTSHKIPAWALEALGMSHRNQTGLIEEAGMAIVAAQMPF